MVPTTPSIDERHPPASGAGTRAAVARLFNGMEVRSDVHALTKRLVDGGAIMTMPGAAPGVLVGHLRWLDDNRMFWFVAYGDTRDDAWLFRFDEVQIIENFGVYFLEKGNVLGYLSTIDAAGLDDPEDYRIAWQLWQQVAPLRMRFIDDCCSRLDEFSDARWSTPSW